MSCNKTTHQIGHNHLFKKGTPYSASSWIKGVAFASLTTLTGLYLSACGGSSDSNVIGENGDNAPVAALQKTETFGQIDAFGSVVVNGVRYNSDNAEITVNGEEAEVADLEVGYIVKITVEGVDEEGAPIAVKIEYTADIIGPIESVDLESGVIRVFNRTIQLSSLTIFGDNLEDQLDTLQPGVVVEISGFAGENEAIEAGYIQRRFDQAPQRLSGLVDNLDAENLTITINGEQISLDQLSDFDFSDLSEGDNVSIEVTVENNLVVAVEHPEFGSFSDVDDDDMVDNSERTIDLTIAGRVRDYDTQAQSFTLHRFDTSLSDEAVFVDGEASELMEGSFVKLEGVATLSTQNNPSFVASSVTFLPVPDLFTVGTVASIDLDAMTITVDGTTYSVDAETAFLDRMAAENEDFGLADLTTGDLVKVRADGKTKLASLIARVNTEPSFPLVTNVFGKVISIEPADTGSTIVLDSEATFVIEADTSITDFRPIVTTPVEPSPEETMDDEPESDEDLIVKPGVLPNLDEVELGMFIRALLVTEDGRATAKFVHVLPDSASQPFPLPIDEGKDSDDEESDGDSDAG